MTISEDIDEIIKNLDGISFEDQTVLITGGAGFLGSWICETLIRLGASVVCVDDLSSGRISNIEPLFKSGRFKFIRNDITNLFPLYFDDHFDLVLHAASRASPFEFEKFPLHILDSSTDGLKVSLKIATSDNARLLFFSTSEVYGNPSVFPTPETYHGDVNQVGPRGCYDEAKRCGEAYVMAYRLQYGLDARIVRIFNTYGPRMREDGVYGRVLPRFIQQALSNQPLTIWGTGMQTRSFGYVTDEIEGLLKFAAIDNPSEIIMNIGNDNEMPMLDVARMIIDLTDSDSEFSFHPPPGDDPYRRRPDISRAKNILGWHPRTSLRDGLQKTIEALR